MTKIFGPKTQKTAIWRKVLTESHSESQYGWWAACLGRYSVDLLLSEETEHINTKTIIINPLVVTTVHYLSILYDAGQSPSCDSNYWHLQTSAIQRVCLFTERNRLWRGVSPVPADQRSGVSPLMLINKSKITLYTNFTSTLSFVTAVPPLHAKHCVSTAIIKQWIPFREIIIL